MQYQLLERDWMTVNTPCLVLGIYTDGDLTESAMAFNTANNGYLSDVLRQGDCTGTIGDALLLYPPHTQTTHSRVLLIGCGKKSTALTPNAYIKILKETAKLVKKLNITQMVCTLSALPITERDVHWNLRRFVALWEAETTRRHTLKTKAPEKPHPLAAILLSLPENATSANHRYAITQAQAIANAIQVTRELSDLPPNLCNPAYLAATAKKLSEAYPERITFQALDETQLQAEKMQGYLAVGLGSRNGSILSILQYAGAPDRNAPPIVLAGKGMTFDSGGISIKPAGKMDEMKYDMCGAAAVLGVMHAAAALALPVNLIGMLAGCENMPGGGSYRPGDVLTMHAGLTVEVLNTDAEGRLVLADVLAYAEKHYQPRIMIDLATLTGACTVALGGERSGLFSNDPALQSQLLEAGEATEDKAWPLPLDEAYDETLKSSIADLTNCGGREAGAITAARFLKAFVKDTPWAHIDIAGTAYRSGKHKAATGRPVELLTEFLIRQVGAT